MSDNDKSDVKELSELASMDNFLLLSKLRKYHYGLFADHHEILQIELDEQEDIIKFRTDRYREHGFNSIYNQ
jgi:hypothetical protein